MLDLDNTLADRQGAVSAWAREFCDEHALPDGAAERIVSVDQDGYADRCSVFETIRSRYELSDSIETLLGAYRQRVVELMTLCEGADTCLDALRTAGHLLAIVTNGSSQQQHAKIDALGLRTAVDVIVVSGDVGIAKPDRAIFDMAADAAGTTLAESWMVGDSPLHDIEGAERAGSRTAWLHRGRRWERASIEPTITIDSLTDLPRTLASARRRTD